ncbi:hypothetical protein RN001_012686 [Aquatica leii]|uniref:DUF7041 domain-containing protein n=1 Tax=Aquatica leii TaxID=1421715 RepID=A0AAN7P3L0_9COLE|nr:hypothetical protein RN001_012686 [Aquatica leii]
MWFSVVEAQFVLSSITADSTKYFTVVAHLDQKSLGLVSDIIANPHMQGKYESLRNALISRLTESENSKLQKLLHDFELGDRTPSQLLREMKSLSGSEISVDLLKKLWLQRLPQQVQIILTISSESLENFTSMADKILETYVDSNNISEIARQPKTSSSITINQTPAPSAWEQKLNELRRDMLHEVNKISAHNVEHRRRNRYQSRNRFSSRKPRGDGVCYYHCRFADKAKKNAPSPVHTQTLRKTSSPSTRGGMWWGI